MSYMFNLISVYVWTYMRTYMVLVHCNPGLDGQLDSWDAEEHTINKIVEYICVFSIAFE